MINSWELDNQPDDKSPLINIVSGLVAPAEVSESLLGSRENGVESAKNFIENRLMSKEVSFWKPVAKANTKTFAYLNKSVSQKKGKENHIIVNSDRQIWSRLAIASKTRETDFCDVLIYELSPVPPALCNLNGCTFTSAEIASQGLSNDSRFIYENGYCSRYDGACTIDRKKGRQPRSGS